MLGILLSILKTLGIILLAVLVFVILILLVLLFVPVRYRVSGKWNTEEKKIEGKAAWLFGLMNISVLADKDGQHISPKIMGISLKKSKKKKQKGERLKKREKKKKRKKEKKRGKKENNSQEDNLKKEETDKEKLFKLEEKETEKKVEEEREEVYADDTKESAGQEKNDAVTQNLKKGIFQKIYEKIISMLSAISKISETWKKLLGDVQELQRKKDKIFDFFCEKEALEAKDKTFKIVKKTIHHIRPQKLKASVKFGLKNPADTGQLYGILCQLYGIYGKNIFLEPDFEHNILEGEFQFKGRIRLINLIYYVIYLYRIKKLREFIELLRNL